MTRQISENIIKAAEFTAAGILFTGLAISAWFPGMASFLPAFAVPALAMALYLGAFRPQSLLGFALLLAPMSTEHSGIHLVDWISLLPLAILLLRGAASLGNYESIREAFFSTTSWLICSFCIWLCVSAVLSISPEKAWPASLRLILPLLALLFAKKDWVRFSREHAWRYAAGMGAVLFFAVFLSPTEPKISGQPFFSGDNAMAGALLPLLFISLQVAGSMSKKIVAWAFAGLVTAWIVWISRGAMLGVAAGALVVVSSWAGNARLRQILLVLGVGVLAFLLWPRENPSVMKEQAVFSAVNRFSNEERVMRWELALRMTDDHPLTGVGPGCFAPEFKHYLRNDEEVAKISYWFGWTGGAHQIFLGAAAEMGWPGLVLLIGWVVAMAIQGFKRAFSKQSTMTLAFAAWVALIVHMQVEDLIGVDACFLAFAWLGMAFVDKNDSLAPAGHPVT